MVELKRKDMLPVKDRVIEVVDRVLKHSEPTAKEMAEFREFYNAR